MQLTLQELILLAHFRKASAIEQRRIEQFVDDDDYVELSRLLSGDAHETLKVSPTKGHYELEFLRGQV